MNQQKCSCWPLALLIALAALTLTAPQAAWACGGGIICVDKDAVGANNGASWANAYTNLQAALDHANANGSATYEIWVAEGVYYPDEGGSHLNNAVSETFLIAWNNVQLYGGFAGNETARSQRDWALHTTILSGDIDGNDTNTDGNSIAETWNDLQGSNAYHVLYLDGMTNQSITTVIDGFIITAGHAYGGILDNGGGGIYCIGNGTDHACNPVLSNIIVIGNLASSGGGMLSSGDTNGASAPSLINVTFSGNWANHGGGMYNNGASNGMSNPTLTNVTFNGNQAGAHGGGMYNNGDAGASSPSLTNVIFNGNSAGVNGGGMYSDGNTGISNPRLTNVVFSGNKAGYGGGMYNYGYLGDSSPSLTNVTFGGNAAVTTGGGMYNNADTATSRPTVVNCILWGNTAMNSPQIHNNGGTPTVMYSDVQGGYTGTGNLNVNPRFVAPITATAAPTITGNYRLQATSPVINAGNSLSVTAATDLDGNPRIVGVAVDMGAYETQTSNTAPTLSVPDASMAVNSTRSLNLWDYAADAEDPDSTLTFAVMSVSTGSLTANLGGDGHTLHLTPTTDWTGSATVAVSVTDSGGLAANDSFVVTVTGGGNTPPTLSIPAVSLNINEVGTLNLWEYASDAEDADATLVFTVESVSTASLTVTLSGGHTLNLTPATDWSGAATVAVSVGDPGGLSVSDAFNVNVGNVVNYLYLPLILRNWPPLPDTPALQSIENGDSDGAYTVQWTAAARADSYEVQEDDNGAFSSPTRVYSGTATYWNDSGKAIGGYYYRVRGQNAYGAGLWSNIQSVWVLPTAFTAVEDAYIAQGSSNGNYGKDLVMRAGYDSFFTPQEQIVRSLIKFDLSTIPANATVISAVVQIRYMGSLGEINEMQNITAYRITSEWVEYDVTWKAAPGMGEAYGSVALKTSSAWYDKYYSIDVTDLVRGWINGAQPNHGILLRGSENVPWCAFATRENGSREPLLRIVYGAAATQVALSPVAPETLDAVEDFPGFPIAFPGGSDMIAPW